MDNDARVGDVIGVVNATDQDTGQFGLIQYAILRDDVNYFGVDPITVCHDQLRWVKNLTRMPCCRRETARCRCKSRSVQSVQAVVCFVCYIV